MSDSMNFLDAVMNGNEEAMHYAVYLYENAEKYRWHDLRKDPNDLPKEKGRKYIITQCKNDKFVVAEWSGDYFGNWTCLFSDDGETFAELAEVDRWKEIEPFKELKETL